MESKLIRISGISDLTEFVAEANCVLGDVLVKRGKFVVDGKSVMGMMSIDVNEGVRVEYPAAAYDFTEYIKKFEVES